MLPPHKLSRGMHWLRGAYTGSAAAPHPHPIVSRSPASGPSGPQCLEGPGSPPGNMRIPPTALGMHTAPPPSPAGA